ncbi:hypothetical protein L914_20576, partial [Phytophthora nicotianae]
VMTAALSSDLTLLKWIEATTPELFHRAESRAKQVAFDAAPDRGCLKSVKWLVETFPGAVWPLGLAAHGGNLEMVQWLHEHANFDGAQLPGDFDDVGDVLELFSNVFLVEDFAGGENRLKPAGLRFVCGRRPRVTDSMDWAALGGHLDVLQWLDANRNDGCSPEAVNGAAEAGHFQILLWLNSHYSAQWTSQAMDYAAQGGQLEIVKWMHDNRTKVANTTAAMNSAAESGHLDVVKWLHGNRTEGTTSAMNNAAANGHLDVVKWLQVNRSEGCTTRAMDLAAGGGHLEMVRWLPSNRAEGCTTEAVDGAASERHLDVVKFLYVNRTEGWTT